MKLIKGHITATVIAGALIASSNAMAYTIDPDGPGGDAPINVSTLDWNVGNLYVECADNNPQGGQNGCVSGNPANLAVGDLLQSYAHASLSVFDDAGTTAGTSLGTNYEWTFVSGFQEAVVLASGGVPGSAAFVNTLGGNNFFEIWYDTGLDADQLIGGETMNNGTLILSGTVLPYNAGTGIGSGAFTAFGNGVSLDQFGSNNYAGVTSIAGAGGANLDVAITSIDTDFFTGGDLSSFLLNFTTSQTLAYQQTNPSSCFYDGTGIIDGAGGGYGTCTGSAIGLMNGDPGEASPATIFQADANSSLPVPTPAPMALIGLGLMLLGLRRKQA